MSDQGKNIKRQSKVNSKRSILIQTNIKGKDIDERDCKLSDLRAREQKVKKVEEELKIREKELESTNKDRLKLENYIKSIEARNNELEMTVKTLQKRIESLSMDKNTPNPLTNHSIAHAVHSTNPFSGYLNDQIMHVHKRVTSIVMKQIDTQLNKLEESLETNNDTQSRKSEKDLNYGQTTHKEPASNTVQSVENNEDCNPKTPNPDLKVQLANEDNDCILVRYDRSNQPHKGQSQPHKNSNGNKQLNQRVNEQNLRYQNTAFINNPHRIMTKNLARYKYKANQQRKEGIEERKLQKSMPAATNRDEQIIDITKQTTPIEISEEPENTQYHFLGQEETFIDLK